jgi:cytochrome d ubiquinol oxidase subunit I
VQPTKFAAMEAVWDTQKAAPYNLIVMPDPANERNTVEALGVPKMLSYLAFHDGNAEVKGLKDFPKDDRPPVTITFLSFRVMAGLGMLFMLLGLVAFVASRRDRLESYPGLLRIMFFALFLPYLGVQIGWILAEVGRQPWIVYGLLRTSDAVSKAVDGTQVFISLVGFTLLYGFLGAIGIYLMVKYAKKGPEEDLSVLVSRTRAQEV